MLVGPTAVGKTELALDLASALGAEIVNADSMQVYRELDIGTAKPTPAERARVSHHLVDVADPDEPYDAARYTREGRETIALLHRRGVPPLVVGGTGLYIKALLAGLFHQEEEVREVRLRLARELADQGLPALLARLQALDPATARRLAKGDTYRIVRALEVVEATGHPLSEAHRGPGFPGPSLRHPEVGLGASPGGALPENRGSGWTPCWPRVGWKKCGFAAARTPGISPSRPWVTATWWAHLEGRLSSGTEAPRQTKRTRRYAKRQLTWFRADPEVRWFHPGQGQEALDLLKNFFQR